MIATEEQRPGVTPTTGRDAPKRTTGRLILGSVLIVVGLLWTAERAGWIELSATAVLALATMIVGCSLMALARSGGHTGLSVFGISLAVATALTAAAPLEGFQGGVGDRTIQVNTAADLKSDYDLSAGSLVLDLSELTWEGDVDPVEVNVGLGELVVYVPDDVAVKVRARSGAGDVTVFDQTGEGLFVDERYASPDFDSAARRITIEANVFLGSVEVTDQ